VLQKEVLVSSLDHFLKQLVFRVQLLIENIHRGLDGELIIQKNMGNNKITFLWKLVYQFLEKFRQ
jgi:hypothetical protein